MNRPHAQEVLPIPKRIIVCCDGTWQDGIIIDERWKYTNVLRLARAINHSDDRHNPPISQVVFYQSGIGTDNSIRSRIVDGATGHTLGDKVQEAYAFLAHNYQPGDQIFLFGFSRGAYTARMVAQFVGHIGVLDRQDMDHFADIFVNFQKRGKAKDPNEIAQLDRQLDPWMAPTAKGKLRVTQNNPSGFTVKCVGVFDTVGSLGLPEELTVVSHTMREIFGFNGHALGDYIGRAYHAMGINERREDFDVCKYQQTDNGRRKGQILKQHWFAGVHCDIGGGYQEHDLSDITLTWMAANVQDMLSLDYNYLFSRPDPVAPWGQQPPHDSEVGVYKFSGSIQRALPTVTDNITYEMIHPSALAQLTIQPLELNEIVRQNPAIVAPLMDLEQSIRDCWPRPTPHIARTSSSSTHPIFEQMHHKLSQKLHQIEDNLFHSERIQTEGGEPVYDENWAGRHATPFAQILGSQSK